MDLQQKWLDLVLEGAVEVEDVKHRLPDFNVRPGMTSWKVTVTIVSSDL